MTETQYVLFLCTGNSARSIIAEALLNHYGALRFKAYSAGSQPMGRVNPLALEILQARQVHLPETPRSKSWDEFAGKDAQPLNYVITVCGNAAAESCPIWPGKIMRTHWGLADPAAVAGDLERKHAAFAAAFECLERRIKRFITLPFATITAADLQQQLNAIGEE